MDEATSITALQALAHPTRLQTFRVLIRHAPDGVAAGELARQVGVPQNTLSTHLAILARAGLVLGTRHSRSIIYRAQLPQVQALIGFLVNDCCQGRPEVCGLVPEPLAACCPPEPQP